MIESLEAAIQSWNGESVTVSFDEPTDSWIFIAMHDTRLGPASGGTRLKSYDHPVDGLIDALRLAEGMTYKWAGVQMPFGGGKAVLATPGPLEVHARAALLDRYASRLTSLRGAFQTGVDLGTTPEDMARIGALSGHAVGVMEGHRADPGPYTALGVFLGMRAALVRRFGSDSFEGRSVLIQGVGDVGLPLAEMLADAGVELFLTDIDETVAKTAAQRLGAKLVPVEDMWEVVIDIYAPCAIGATLNPQTISTLRCQIVAGSANNQLLTPTDAEALHLRQILYAPDFVINAGGAIAFGNIHLGERDSDRLRERVHRIESSLTDIFDEAAVEDESPLFAAQRRARRFLEAAG